MYPGVSRFFVSKFFCQCSWVWTLEPKKRYPNGRGSVFQTESSWSCFTPELRSEEARAAPSRTLTITCGRNSLWWNLVNITFRCDSWDLAFRKTCRKALQTSGHNLLRLSEGWFEQGGVICLEKNRVQHCFPYFLIRQYGLEEAARGKVNFRSQGGRIKVLPRLNFWAAKTRSCRWKIEEQSKSRARNKTFGQPWRPFNYISTWRSHKIIQFHLPSLLLMEALYNQLFLGTCRLQSTFQIICFGTLKPRQPSLKSARQKSETSKLSESIDETLFLPLMILH